MGPPQSQQNAGARGGVPHADGPQKKRSKPGGKTGAAKKKGGGKKGAPPADEADDADAWIADATRKWGKGQRSLVRRVSTVIRRDALGGAFLRTLELLLEAMPMLRYRFGAVAGTIARRVRPALCTPAAGGG